MHASLRKSRILLKSFGGTVEKRYLCSVQKNDKDETDSYDAAAGCCRTDGHGTIGRETLS
jgi:hypothetical protein